VRDERDNIANMPPDDSARPPLSAGPPLSLAQLLALARAHTIDEQTAALEHVERGSEPAAEPTGDPYLLFTCADAHCAAPLTHFHEVLPALPTTVALPFSPPWMLGLFALHTELIGLVDPAPFLFDAPEMSSISRARLLNGRTILPGSTTTNGQNWRLATPESGPTALIVGTGERMLALAVGNVSDMAYVQPDAILAGVDKSTATGTALAARFLVGSFDHPAPDGSVRYHVVDIETLLDTVLGALTSAEAQDHE
jgi:chemotaxis signal transduction protein